MTMESRQMYLIYALLRRISWDAQYRKSFTLFFGGFLCDMVSRTKARPVLDSGWNIGFRRVLCQGNTVLAVALPYAVREDGKETPLFPWEEDALRTAGIPLFADLLVEETAENGEKVLSMRDFTCPEPSGWSFPAIDVPQEARDFLIKKGLILRDKDAVLAPTEEGKRLGLCSAGWFRPSRSSGLSRMKSLSCSVAGWLYRLWAPREAAPLWTVLPLDTRLERMRTGRAGSVGHTISALERLDAMPLEPLLLERIREQILEEKLERFQKLYKPGITYGEAARDADRWMRSERDEVRRMGSSSFGHLATLFYSEYNLRKVKGGVRSPKQKITAIHQTKPAGRSLSERLAWAGVSENACRYLPLAGDDLEDVFQGLSILLGDDEPARSFYQNVLPRIMPGWDRSEEQKKRWDGTFDGLIAAISDGLDAESHDGECACDKAPPCLNFWDQVVWQLLIAPFCLLDQARRLEEERGRLLERFQERNKQLKQELKGMDFDGNEC